MPKNIGVAEVKKSISAVISEVSMKGEHFIIEKKGKPMAALVTVQELQRFEGSKKKRKKGVCWQPSAPGRILKIWKVQFRPFMREERNQKTAAPGLG